MKTLISWLLKKTSGWKTIVAYILMQIPFFSANPMLIGAIKKVLEDPSNVQAWAEVIVQLLLAIGIIHRLVKNVDVKHG